jgi:hypothetical protein
MVYIRKILFLLLVTNVCTANTYAGDSTLQLQLLRRVMGNFCNFSVDNLGNIFLLTTNNEIKKINNKFDSVGLYNNVKQYGTVTAFDVSNPLKVLVYYKNFATIVVLDRFLNSRNSIYLRQSNILQGTAIAQSYDNNIWLFDEVDNKIKKIDETGKTLVESADFRQLFNNEYVPQKIVDANGSLYLYQPKTGWKILDYYGAFKQQLSITGWQDVQVVGALLMGRDSSLLYQANPQKLQFDTLLPTVNIAHALKVQRMQNLVYVLQNDGLNVYRMMP